MLKTISVKQIEYAVNERPILQGVSFRATVRERLCIFGENGAGKSTLLKIICGELEADAGQVVKEGHIRFLYVPQEFGREYADMTIAEYMKEKAGEPLYKKVFALGKTLGFNLEKNTLKKCGSLSGGQQKIVALSVAFANNPDFILLDEPENHLDIVSRKELIGIMDDFGGGIIFISHDRLIIDSIATKIAEVAQGKMYVSEGNYDDYIEMKMNRISGLQRAYDAETKRIRQLEKSIVILQQKAFRGKEVSAYRKAKEELDGLKREHKESSRPDDEKTKIKLGTTSTALYQGKLLWKIKNGSYAYDNSKHLIFKDVDLEIRSGNRIVLLGRNGSGKSTFLKCLTGHAPLSQGELSWAPEISWSYFDQHAEFDAAQTPIQIVSEKLNCLETEAQAALGAMKFDLPRMKTSAGNLSGGERMRIRFAIAFGKKPDLIILDEPTNHIDEVTWEILLDACKSTKSSILLVTHDYEFIQEFNPSLFWMIKDQHIVPRHKELDVLLDEMRG